MRSLHINPSFGWIITIILMSGSCTSDTAEKHYLLAERLWSNKDYSASVVEFERTAKKDKKGKLGLQALFRAAMTETLFLGEHTQALDKFYEYINYTGDTELAWIAQKEIGEIYFGKLRKYSKAVVHYKSLINQKPNSPDVPMFLMRIAKCYRDLFRFDDAIKIYLDVIDKFKKTQYAEKAYFEMGATYFIRGDQHPRSSEENGLNNFQYAIDYLQDFLIKYPKSELAPQAEFYIASSLEEMDHLEQAFLKYESLLNHYSSPEVIRVKLARIKERMAVRRR